MRVTVPVETAVYTRRTRLEHFTFKHISISGYQKHLPLSLAVSDLKQHSLDKPQRKERENAPQLVLITGASARVFTLANWKTPKKCSTLKPRDFLPDKATNTPKTATNTPKTAAYDDLDNDYVFLRTYTTLTTYTAKPNSTYCPFQVSTVEAAGIILPRRITERDVPNIETQFRFALDRAKKTATWVIIDPPGDQAIDHFNEQTLECKPIRSF